MSPSFGLEPQATEWWVWRRTVFTLCPATKERFPAMERRSIMHYWDTDADSNQI